jgi:hypothetical protein
MIDDFETRVGLGLRRMTLPSAPASLRARVHEIAAVSPRTQSRRRSTPDQRWQILVAAAALVAIAGGALLFSGGTSVPVTTASPSPATTPQASQAATVDGLPLLTVSEAIAKRDSGELGNQAVAIRGYWSFVSVILSCGPPSGGQAGDLEIYCNDGFWGITELDEPIAVFSPNAPLTKASGPALTPYVGDAAGRQTLFDQPFINGQQFPPVPIIVVGHFDDPRAAECRAIARQLCKDRLVLDRIVQFDPSSVPTPAPTPSPTPFPFADPPPPLFDASRCLANVAYGFVGWTTLAALGINQGESKATGFAMITRDAVSISDWSVDPNGAGKWRMWGRRVCISFPEQPGVVSFYGLPMFKVFSDGHREPYQSPST